MLENKSMVMEVAVLNVIPGRELAFEKDFKLAGKYISSIEGYGGHTLKKCLEKQNQYVLLVHWESLENHEIGYRQSEAYVEWKNLLHHYYDPFPTVEHYETVV